MNNYKSINNIEKENKNKNKKEAENTVYKLAKDYLEEEHILLKKKKDFLLNDLNAFIKELDAEEEIKEKVIQLKEQFGIIEEKIEEKIEENKEENKEENNEEKDLIPKKKCKKYEDLDDFIIENADNIIEFSEEINVDINRFYSWINIKIIGTIFITLYFIGILEIIGLLNTLGKEIKGSLELTLLNKTRENNFYQNYISENLNAPSFNVFFLSAIFSDILINLLTFPGTILLLFVIISCIIGFGVDSFKFHVGESLNVPYEFKENMILILIYIGIYIFIGAIALIPHDIIQNGYSLYDLQWLDKIIPEKNGYIFAYLFSMVASSIIKIVLDRKFVNEGIKSRIKSETNNSLNFFVIIILIYLASTISSLIIYFIYKRIFIKTKKHGDDNSHEAIKIFGYFIYCQTEGGCCKNCVDCQKLVKKCSRCFGFYKCECCRCCYCCCTDYDEAEYGQKQLCIIYKLKGICSWIGDLLAGLDNFRFALIIYGFELINIGFNPALSKYLDNKKEEEEITKINVISLVSRLLFYFLNLCCGILCLKLFRKYKEYFEKFFPVKNKNTEFDLIFQSIMVFSFIFVVLNTIISGICYFQEKNKDIYYFIPISISISEYANIILLYYSKNLDFDVEIIKKSVAISFYKMIFTVFKFIIDLFEPDNRSLVLFQFIFGCIVMGICILYILIFIIPKVCIYCLKGKD